MKKGWLVLATLFGIVGTVGVVCQKLHELPPHSKRRKAIWSQSSAVWMARRLCLWQGIPVHPFENGLGTWL